MLNLAPVYLRKLAVATAFGLAVPAAFAGANVNWSISVGNAYPAPVNVGPQIVYVQPQPVYVQPQRVYVRPRPVYLQPQPIYVQPGTVVHVGAPYYMEESRHKKNKRSRWGHGRGHRHDRHY